MAAAPKIIVIVDYLTQNLRVYSNLPNVMVEAEEINLEEGSDEDARDLEMIKGEYPYLQFGAEDEDSE